MPVPSDIIVRPVQRPGEDRCMNCSTPFNVLIFNLGTLRVRICKECLDAVNRSARLGGK